METPFHTPASSDSTCKAAQVWLSFLLAEMEFSDPTPIKVSAATSVPFEDGKAKRKQLPSLPDPWFARQINHELWLLLPGGFSFP